MLVFISFTILDFMTARVLTNQEETSSNRPIMALRSYARQKCVNIYGPKICKSKTVKPRSDSQPCCSPLALKTLKKRHLLSPTR